MARYFGRNLHCFRVKICNVAAGKIRGCSSGGGYLGGKQRVGVWDGIMSRFFNSIYSASILKNTYTESNEHCYKISRMTR